MYENLNELIELNLKLLNKAPNKKMFRTDFKDEKGISLRNSTQFAKILDEKRLINLEKGQGFRCDLTEFGQDIFEKGGWLIHLEAEKIKTEKAESKEILEFQILKLQKESSEYQKSIRDKEEQIRNLTRDNLRLGNWDIRFRWYIAVISFISGLIFTYLIGK